MTGHWGCNPSDTHKRSLLMQSSPLRGESEGPRLCKNVSKNKRQVGKHAAQGQTPDSSLAQC